MLYFIGSILFLAFVLIGAPHLWLSAEGMRGYGNYLTGVAAIGAAIRWVVPYLLIFFYRKAYANEITWKGFWDLSCPKNNGQIHEPEWVGGVINYFRRCESTLHMGNPWYENLPYLSDDIYHKFERSHLIGKKEDGLFREIKELLYGSAEIVSMNSTPDAPINKKDKYEELHSKFKALVGKFDEMNKLVQDAPIPVKKIIEGNEIYRSFFSRQ